MGRSTQTKIHTREFKTGDAKRGLIELGFNDLLPRDKNET